MKEHRYFETIKCDDFEIYNLEYHNKRVAKTVGMNIDLNEYIYPISSKLLKCKVVYNDYEIEDVSYSEYTPRDIKSFKIVHANNLDYSKKYLDRSELDELFLQRGEADELMIFKDNLLTDTTIANIAIFDGELWLTPKTPLLEGTCRARLLEQKEIVERDITLEMLQEAKAIALMNAMIGFKKIEDYSFLL